jgi:3-hydroxyisobutyrate dehydrogenase-like beta-hydroxyacid dehydrogenase
VSRVGVLHPGAMGAAIGTCLVDAGHEVLWASAGRSSQTAARAEAGGLTDVASVDELAARSEVVLSICPPDAALDVAGSLRGYRGVLVDANAVAPATAARIAAATEARYVDGGIIGPPPTEPGTTRLYLSGDEAERVAALFASTRLDARLLPAGGATAASALKMAYAAWTKGSAALLLAVEQAAATLDVAAALHEEWGLSQPALAQRSHAARAAAVEKGWRWTGEMREIAATMRAAGVPDGFHAAAADVFDGFPRPAASART